MSISRRDFVKGAASAPLVVGTGLALSREAEAKKPARKIERFRELGSTGLKISDLGLGGSGGLRAPDAVRHAIDLGINFVDTAPDYNAGKSEETFGKVFKSSSVRTKMVVQTKFCHPHLRHLPASAPLEDVLAAVEGSLKRLHTDYIDILLIHSVGGTDDIARARAEVFREAITRLKKDGKVRFAGCSSHGPALVPVITDAIEIDHFDTFLLAYNYLADPAMLELVKRLKAKGKGLVAMKTLRGITEETAVSVLGKRGGDLHHSAFKWVWDNGADSLVVGMPSSKQQDRYIGASGGSLATRDVEMLERYAAAIHPDTCRLTCGDECESACPHSVAIADSLRNHMYYADYGEPRRGTEGYARLGPRDASACVTCIDTPCVSACVKGLPVSRLLERAHDQLRTV